MWPQKRYVVFYNGFFFDPWSAIGKNPVTASRPDSRNRGDDEGYLYPGRLNVMEMDSRRVNAVKRYVAFQNWITQV